MLTTRTNRGLFPTLFIRGCWALLCSAGCLGVLRAQTTLYWDTNGATAGAGGATPSATWKTSGGANKNWSTSSAGTTTTANWTNDDIAVFSASTDATGSFTVTVASAPTVDSIAIEEGNPTFNNSSLTLTGSTPSIDVASGSTATFNTKLLGSNGLVKTGSGTLVLNALGNNYTGATTVSAGALNIGSGNNILPNATDLSIASGASVSIADGGNTHTLNSISGAGEIDFGDNLLRIAGSDNTTFSGVISDNGGTLQQQGTGTLTLSGNNTFTGAVDLNHGVIIAASNNALGAVSSGDTVANGSALQFTGGVHVSETDIAVKGTGTDGTGALRSLSGNNTFSAATTLSGNTTVTADSGTFTMDGDFTMGSYDLDVGGAGNVVFSGALSGGASAKLTKDGAGTLTLSGTSANTASGAVTVNDGTLQLNKTAGTNALGGGNVTVGDGTGAAGSAVLQLLAGNQIADSTARLTVNSDGKLDLNNFSESVDGLTSTGIIATGTSGYLGVGLNGGNSAISGSLTGAGTFAQLGTGTLTLNSNIDFSGGTFVISGGTVKLNGYQLLADTLHITADSTINFGGSSTLNVLNFLIDSGTTLTIANWAHGMSYFYASSWSGASYDTNDQAPMNQVVFQGWNAGDTHWDSDDNQITPAPEPATYGAILLAAMTLLFLGHRFRSRAKGRN